MVNIVSIKKHSLNIDVSYMCLKGFIIFTIYDNFTKFCAATDKIYAMVVCELLVVVVLLLLLVLLVLLVLL